MPGGGDSFSVGFSADRAGKRAGAGGQTAGGLGDRADVRMGVTWDSKSNISTCQALITRSYRYLIPLSFCTCVIYIFEF